MAIGDGQVDFPSLRVGSSNNGLQKRPLPSPDRMKRLSTETNIGTLTASELEPVEKMTRQCPGLDEWLHLRCVECADKKCESDIVQLKIFRCITRGRDVWNRLFIITGETPMPHDRRDAYPT